MPENTGPVAAQHRVMDAAIQTAYAAFIHHTQACVECRTGGMDCAVAGDLRQAYRAAKKGPAQSR
ncbi:hypothetical protein ABZ622_36310 [Streptomyces sp. NPDC007164]|uniref:hypothetical protein n=1 Tax=Streptomyces sp. NPDC007164 TaxID=3156918 RepID=UPI0033CE6C98